MKSALVTKPTLRHYWPTILFQQSNDIIWYEAVHGILIDWHWQRLILNVWWLMTLLGIKQRRSCASQTLARTRPKSSSIKWHKKKKRRICKTQCLPKTRITKNLRPSKFESRTSHSATDSKIPTNKPPTMHVYANTLRIWCSKSSTNYKKIQLHIINCNS